jgi:hypothetical protein
MTGIRWKQARPTQLPSVPRSRSIPCRLKIPAWRWNGRWSPNLDAVIQEMNNSVGSPPGTTCSGACACATACEQRRQAYLGRRVTSTRNRAGITSGRSDRRRENGPPDRFPILLHLADLRHLATAAGALHAGGPDHALDPGQIWRQMSTVTPGLAGRFRARAPQGGLRLLLCGLEHALGKPGIFQRQVELVG